MTAKKPGESSSFRAIGESDRTPEFKRSRSELIGAVDEAFDTLYELKDNHDRPLKFGSVVFGVLGVKRDVVDNPLGGSSLIQESAKTHPGLYVATDPRDGHEVITMRRPDKSLVEIRRDPLVKSLVVSDDPEGDWSRPVANSGHEMVVSFRETQPDGGAVGFSVNADGSVKRTTTEPGRRGMNSSMALGPADHEGVDTSLILLQTARADFFVDRSDG